MRHERISPPPGDKAALIAFAEALARAHAARDDAAARRALAAKEPARADDHLRPIL